MKAPLVTIILVVHNGERFLRRTLDSVRAQTMRDFEVLILDNASADATASIAAREYPEFRLFKSRENVGPWAGFEKLISRSQGEYVMLCTDVILKPDFLQRTVSAMRPDGKIGALQAKIYQMELYGRDEPKLTNLIDTTGFELYKSRKLLNRGHGQEDKGQFSAQADIFGVEGAVPVFRRKALEDCRIPSTGSGQESWLIDPNYRVGSLGYGDDFDLAWRMRLFGWKEIYVPGVVAYHDRSTTKGVSKVQITGQLARREQRARIPLEKRRLDWSNVRFTIIKNDYIINILKDLPRIAAREIMVLGYTLLFEPGVLKEAGRFFRLLPAMLRTRRAVMARAKLNASDMRSFLT